MRDKICKSLRDQSASVTLFFAFSLPLMMLGAGVAIDYSRASQAKTRLQAALDAGVLAAAIDAELLTDADREKRIQTFVSSQTRLNEIASPSIAMRPTNGRIISATASGCVKTVFKGFVGTEETCVVVKSEVERPLKTYLEVALVLDNSISMQGEKLEEAKASATRFVDYLFAGVKDPEQVKISVVPFTLTVNAGSGMDPRSNSNLDRFGKSSIHWENLVPDGVTAPAGVGSRFALFDQLGERWTGCLEMRPGNFGVNDASPNPSIPDSLFVPMFAPDEPGPLRVRYIKSEFLNPNGNGRSFEQFNSYLNDDGSESVNYDASGKETTSINAACSPKTLPFRLANRPISNVAEDKNWFARLKSNLCRYNLTGTPGDIAKRKFIRNMSGTDGAVNGPNMMCNAAPLQRLTTNRANIVATINSMVAVSNTNIVEGLMWGWRTLSPNQPFADGRKYTWTQGLIRNRKVIVLMTDGDNYWPTRDNPTGSNYSPFGYFTNNRIGTGINANNATKAMNTKTLQACNNAKALRTSTNEEAIQIYTIGFSTARDTISQNGVQLLRDCASTEKGRPLYYEANDTAQLAKVFADVAGNIGKLRLTR